MAAVRQKAPVLKVLLPIFVILGVTFAALSWVKHHYGNAEKGAQALAVGDTLPDLRLYPFQGAETALSKVSGKVFLVNFWASWCQSCMVEMPSIVNLWKDMKAQGFEVLAVNVDENPDAVIPRIKKQFSMDFGIYLDKNSELGDLFDVHAIPTTIIVNKQGKILHMESGERVWDSKEVKEQVKRWLTEA